LGKGGFGSVELVDYLGHVAAAKIVDLKGLGSNKLGVERLRRTFAKELEAMVLLRSEHVVDVYGAMAKDEERLVLLLELMEEGDLRSMLSKDSKPLERDLCRQLAMDISWGMEYLHSRRMVYGGLKFPNILLTGELRAKVRSEGSGVNRFPLWCFVFRGEEQLGSPEVKEAPDILNQDEITQSSDVYSYGIIFWEILTRKVPWEEVGRPVDIILKV
ncbi:unnamed protein product, partial [Discosporangium mesarthrocarpum]